MKYLLKIFLIFNFVFLIFSCIHASFTITAGTVTLTNSITVDVSSDIVIESAGTLDAGDCLINIGRRFDNSGTFISGTSTVSFYTTLVSTITGNTTFYCFRCEIPNKQLNFTSGSTQTVTGLFTLTGSVGNLIKLRSTEDGVRWSISFPSRSQKVDFVDVKDSNALLNKVTDYNGLNSGNNNENWVFIQDQGPPCAISNLTALTGTLNDGDVKLLWTAPGNDGISGEFTNGLIRIKVATFSITSENFEQIIHNPVYTFSIDISTAYTTYGSEHSYTVTGLNPGTTYYFAIKIKDEIDNWSSWSNVGVNTANFNKALDLPPSEAPSISAISNSSHTINVSWEKPATVYIDDLDKYFIYRATFVWTSTTTANVVHIATVSHPTNVYLDTGLTTNVTYYYRVVAYDKGNQPDGLFSSVLYSPVSVIANACPLPTDPAKVKVSVVWDNRSSNNKNNYDIVDGIEDADGTVTWDWPFIPDGGTITEYNILVSTDKNFSFFISSATLPPTVSTYTVSNLPRGYYVYACVRAKNDEGTTGDWTSSDGIYINRKTINADKSDWAQIFPTSSNTVTVSGGDALWRDAISDQRTDNYGSTQLDISSVGISCDEYNLYLFVAFSSTFSAGFDGRNYIQILVDNDQLSTERVFRGRVNKYEDSYVSKYVPWEYICEIVTGNDQFRVEDNLWSNRKYGKYTENNSQYYYEVAIPLSYLGGSQKFLGKTVNFTIATFWNAGGSDGSIGQWGADNSNIVDVITSTGPNTWNEVSDRIVDYYLSVNFSTSGAVNSAQGIMSTGSTLPDEPEPPSNGVSPAPPSALDYIMYRLFVDAWYNGDYTNDDISDTNDYGGDFQGVIDKIDYLNEMGINMVYFGPFHDFGGGIWGYNVDDIYAHEWKFGGTSKYIEMVKTLKNHNLKLMFDWVPGQVGGPNSPTAKKHLNFYQPEQFSSEGGGTKQEYAEPRALYLNNLIWNMSITDAVRFDNPKFWDYTDGPERFEFSRALRKLTDRYDPQYYLMAEIPETVWDINPYTGSNGPMLHGAEGMKIGGYKNSGQYYISSWAMPGTDDSRHNNASNWNTSLICRNGIESEDSTNKNQWAINPIMMESHDERRFISRGRSDDGSHWGYDSQVGYMAALTVGGPTIIMYGGEIGLEGPYDGWQKEKMDVNGNVRLMEFDRVNVWPWTGVRSSIIRAIQAKANFQCLRGDPQKGGRSWYTGGSFDTDILACTRTGWGQKAIVLWNWSANNIGPLTVATGDPQNTVYKDFLTDNTYTVDGSGNIYVTVNAHYGNILIKGPDGGGSPYDWVNITGKVTDGSGQPIENAIVDIDQKSHWTTRTDSNGNYSLSGDLRKVLTGNRTIRCWAPGYGIVSVSTNIALPGVDRVQNFTLSVDNTSPSAPLNLAGQPRSQAVMLSWQANTEDDFQSYLIYRSTQPIPDGSYPEPIFECFKPYYYDNNLDGKLDSSGNVYDRLQNGTTYYYRIRAVDRNGNKSAFSNQIAVVPRAVKVRFWLDARDSGLLPISSASITGGALTFGNANYGNWPPPVKMDEIAPGVYEKEFEFDDTTFLEYKYILHKGNNIWEGDTTAGTLFLDGSASTSNRGELMDDSVPDVEITDEGNGVMILADKWRYYYDQSPRTPEGLQITAGPQQLTIGWTKNLEPDLEFYTIQRKIFGGSYTEIARVSKDAINYVDINLTNNVTYYYKISATDRRGNTSGWSSEVYDFPREKDTSSPSQPSGLVAYGAGDAGLTAIKIKWDPNYEGDLAGYNLHRSTVSDFNPELSNKLNYTLISPVSTYYIDSNITTGVTYYYKLVAVDSSGNASPASSQISAHLVPVTFEVDIGNISPSNVQIIGNTEPLDWNGSINLTKVSGSSWSITLGMISGTQIQYKYSYNGLSTIEQDFNTGSKNREYTIPYSTTTKYDDWEENPDAVSGVKIYSGVNCAYLYWDRNTTSEDLLGYNVYISVPPSTTPTSKVNPSVLSYSQRYKITGLSANVTYYFLIKPVDSGSVQLETTTGTIVSVCPSSPVYVCFGTPYRIGESTSPWGNPNKLKMYIAVQTSTETAVWSSSDRADVTGGLLEMDAPGDGTYKKTIPLARGQYYNFLFFAKTTTTPPDGLSANTEYYDTVPNTGTFIVSSSSYSISQPPGVIGVFNPAGQNRDARRILFIPYSLSAGSTIYVFANFGSSPTAPTYIQPIAGDNKITLYWSAPYGSSWTWPPPEKIGNIPASSGESMKAVDVICGGVYQIYVCTAPLSPNYTTNFTLLSVVSGSSFTFTHTGLTNGVTYYYLMRSSDTFRGLTWNNFSNFSSTVSAVPTSKQVIVKVRVNSTANPLWKSVRKSIAFQEGITVSAWDAEGRSNLTPTGRAVNMTAPGDDPTEQEFSVALTGGTTYNFILFAYSTFSITGLQAGTTYYDTVPNSGTEGMWTSTSTVSITSHGKAWYGYVGATGDARRLLYVPSDLPSGATLYVYCNFSGRPTQTYVFANPVSSHSIKLEWIPYGSWGTGQEQFKAVDVIAGGFYHIWRSSISQSGPWSLVLSTSSMNWTDEGLVEGVRYYYVVVSSDAYTGTGGTQAQIPNLFRTGAPEFSSADASAVPSSFAPVYFKVMRNIIPCSAGVHLAQKNKKSSAGVYLAQ